MREIDKAKTKSKIPIRGKVFFLILFISGLFAFTQEAKESSTNQSEMMSRMDQSALRLFVNARQPMLSEVAIDLTALGSISVLFFLVLVFVIFFFLKQKNAMALQLLFSALGSALLTTILKFTVEIARPPESARFITVEGFSYPSGHSLSAAAIYSTLAVLLCENFGSKTLQIFIRIVFGALIIMIALSRLYLGLHYVSDVAGGLAIGASWAFLLNWLFDAYNEKYYFF